MSNLLKRKANLFAKQHSLKNISYRNLKIAAENTGYTIIEFNRIFNNADTETIIRNLHLEDAVEKSRGFTYADKDYRLIFINEDLNENEKTLVLAHEIGHIVCEHFNSYPIIGKDVKDEYEANEFSHYLLNQSIIQKIRFSVYEHTKMLSVLLTAVCIIAIISAVGFNVKKQQSYYGDYYITSTGNKYHKKECIFVKDKTTTERLSKKKFETGTYEACDMCLPDK